MLDQKQLLDECASFSSLCLLLREMCEDVYTKGKLFHDKVALQLEGAFAERDTLRARLHDLDKMLNAQRKLVEDAREEQQRLVVERDREREARLKDLEAWEARRIKLRRDIEQIVTRRKKDVQEWQQKEERALAQMKFAKRRLDENKEAWSTEKRELVRLWGSEVRSLLAGEGEIPEARRVRLGLVDDHKPAGSPRATDEAVPLPSPMAILRDTQDCCKRALYGSGCHHNTPDARASSVGDVNNEDKQQTVPKPPSKRARSPSPPRTTKRPRAEPTTSPIKGRAKRLLEQLEKMPTSITGPSIDWARIPPKKTNATPSQKPTSVVVRPVTSASAAVAPEKATRLAGSAAPDVPSSGPREATTSVPSTRAPVPVPPGPVGSLREESPPLPEPNVPAGPSKDGSHRDKKQRISSELRACCPRGTSWSRAMELLIPHVVMRDGHFTMDQLRAYMPLLVEITDSRSSNPSNTCVGNLQRLRDRGQLHFLGNGYYQWAFKPG